MNVLTQEMRTVANRVRWFESAEEALRYPERFPAYLMTYGTLEAISIARKYLSDRAFERALWNAPAGIFETRFCERCGLLRSVESARFSFTRFPKRPSGFTSGTVSAYRRSIR